MKIVQNISFLLSIVLLVFTSCSSEQTKRFEPVPNAYGNANSVIVVADEDIAESTPGDTLKYYLEAAYPILPSPEPLFDIKVYSPIEINAKKERKELRTYVILADMSQKDAPTTQMVNKDLGKETVRNILETKGYATKVVKDKWAIGQILIYVFAKDKDALLENVQKSFPSILQRLNEHDNKQIMATTYFKGNNKTAEKEIETNLGIRMRIPATYKIVMHDSIDNTYWLRYDVSEFIYNILIHKEKYIDQSQLTRENLISIRDSLGLLVSTNTENTRMVVNDKDLPLFVKGTTLNGNFALEAKGIWEIENDFMGGSFVSYLIHNPNTDELVYVDGFLFAPGKSKRDPMQTLQAILQTTSF